MREAGRELAQRREFGVFHDLLGHRVFAGNIGPVPDDFGFAIRAGDDAGAVPNPGTVESRQMVFGLRFPRDQDTVEERVDFRPGVGTKAFIPAHGARHVGSRPACDGGDVVADETDGHIQTGINRAVINGGRHAGQ